MKNKETLTSLSKFAEEVWGGLTTCPKYLPSRFIYDTKGDKLFQKIMAMPEYYLTDCEFAILEKHKKEIARYFGEEHGFDLIELGAGDGKKTKILLRHLRDSDFDFTYLPIDISQHILDDLERSLHREVPEIEVKPQQGTYFGVLGKIAGLIARKKVILVLGSNIGNLLHEEAIKFLKNVQEAMVPGDMLFMGFDQKKNPQTILDAYNDKTGITAAFNKNILSRINRELGGDFEVDNFMHWETYNPETGTAGSFLLSKIPQKVTISKLDLTIDFAAWESIQTEISQKYDDQVVQWLAGKAGLKARQSFTDEKGFYKNYIFEIKD